MMLQCPDCHKPLETRTFQGVQIDSCPICAGIWFDARELGRIMKAGTHALAALEEAVKPAGERETKPDERLCPVCHVPLHKFRYQYESPIELDTCASCHGLWVEDGELAMIQDWLDKQE